MTESSKLNKKFIARVAAGILLQAAVLILPLTPYPLARMLLDRDALEVERGYALFLQKGIWEEGDPGFDLMRREYMTDLAIGARSPFTEEEMLGLSLVAFQVSDLDPPDTRPENRQVYTVFSNQKGSVVPGAFVKQMYGRFHEPYAATLNLALLILGAVSIYSGLRGILRNSLEPIPNPAPIAPVGNALSPSARS